MRKTQKVSQTYVNRRLFEIELADARAARDTRPTFARRLFERELAGIRLELPGDEATLLARSSWR